MAEGIELARVASATALATEGVYAMGPGLYVEAATYDGAEKVSGVIVDPGRVEIHIVVGYPPPRPIPQIGESIIRRVAPQAGARRTTVVVDDLEVVGDENL